MSRDWSLVWREIRNPKAGVRRPKTGDGRRRTLNLKRVGWFPLSPSEGERAGVRGSLQSSKFKVQSNPAHPPPRISDFGLLSGFGLRISTFPSASPSSTSKVSPTARKKPFCANANAPRLLLWLTSPAESNLFLKKWKPSSALAPSIASANPARLNIGNSWQESEERRQKIENR